MSTASHKPYKSGTTSGLVGDSRSTKRHDPSGRDTKPQTQPHSSTSPPNGRTYASDQEHHSHTPGLRRHVSNGSTSSSDYSSASKDAHTSKDAGLKPGTEPKLRRRSGDRSEGASDRRRLAIVQMDPETTRHSSQPHGNGSIRSRRGLPPNLAGLALVAPPDAAMNSYTHLTPPSTAPISGSMNTRDASDPERGNTRQGRGHHKASSEVLNTNKKSPRDVGIVGTGRLSPIRDAYKGQASIPNDDLRPPIFQQPHSRSPSPGAAPDVSDPMRNLRSPVHAKPPAKRRSTEGTLVATPGLGEEKDAGARVAAPVVVSLESARALRTDKRSSRTASPNPSSSAPQIVLQSVPPGTTVFPPSDASPYLNYQPGIHATAGPLPPPPRAMFNIDVNAPPPPRPPRLNSPNPTRSRGDIEAVKQALQLPSSVSAALASRSPKSTATTLESSKVPSTQNGHSKESPAVSGDSPVLHHVKSVHRREGASSSVMTVSDITTSDQVSIPEGAPHTGGRESACRLVENGEPSISKAISEEAPPITVVQPLNTKDEPEKRENGHVDISSALVGGRKSDEVSTGSHSPSRSLSQMKRSDTPSPPPKSFRNSLTTNLRRFASLPRTPSVSSRSTKSVRRLSSPQPSSATPSPPEPSPLVLSAPTLVSSPTPHPHPKVRSQYPSAMYCAEVFGRKTAVERCAIYAHKINELYMYDSGLGDWIIETRIRANMNRPVLAGGNTFTPQPRHTSRASMISEATFPRRPDASTATDLALKATDLFPTVPPALPYPSLAQSQRYPVRSSSLASGIPTSSIRSIPPTSTSKAGVFFASLGRKASMSGRREKPGTASPASSLSSSGTKHLTKTPPANPTPRPVNIPNNPSLPGGPRAPPNRALRSQTIMTTSSSPFSSASSHSNEVLTRRPSLFNLTPESEPIMDIRADPEFVHQVDKLAELLPHADRDVLAGYLRRSGQDILAIGQYLEDEKNGTLKF